ncbi:MAG: universal stress protein [Proteobacteria bacterium]|nr:universal stress protein [Pseudomonadota bacterium]
MTIASHILLGTDFSPAAESAAKLAVQLANLTRARITAVHVYSPALLGPPPGLTTLERSSQETQFALEKALTQALEKLRDDQIKEVADTQIKLIAEDSPADALTKYAKDNGVDLIVVASHGRTGLAHLLIGSVAEKVVRHSPCPVIVAR